MPNTLRSCIIADTGYIFLAMDASQIELKVVARLSQDLAMIQDTETSDMHRATAARVFGEATKEEAEEALIAIGGALAIDETEEDWIKAWLKSEMKSRRYKAKQLNFAILYGAEAFKIAQMADISEAEADELIVLYFQAYPVLSAWINQIKQQAKEDGFVTNFFGRIRPIPDIISGATWKIRAKAERECVNTVVQGTAVDIVKLAMLYLREAFNKQIRLVLQVHDEMVWEVPDALLEQAIEISKELKQAFPLYPFSAKIGKIYGEMEDIE